MTQGSIGKISEPGDVLAVLTSLCDDNQVDNVAEELAQTHFAFLARAASFPELHEYNRATIVRVLGEHWTNDKPAARAALTSALDDPRELVQERAFKSLMRFYRSGDSAVRTLLDTRPLSSYLASVQPTVRNLLSQPAYVPAAPPVLEPRLKNLVNDLTTACETLLELPCTASSNEADTARTECRWALDSLNAHLKGGE